MPPTVRLSPSRCADTDTAVASRLLQTGKAPSRPLSLLSPLSSLLSHSLFLSFSHSLTFSVSLSHSFLSFGRGMKGPQAGSRQRHHSTAVRITVTIYPTVTTVQESTYPAGRSALPAPSPAVSSPRPAVSGSLSSAPVSAAPVSGAFRHFRRSFIRRFCEIGFGIRRSSTVFETVRF